MNEQKIKVVDSMWLGMMLGIGMFSGLGLLVLGAMIWDKITDKIWDSGEKKAAYIVTLGNTHDQNVTTFTTPEVQGKISGQIAFYDCVTGDRIVINTSVQVVKMAKIPVEAAQTCQQIK